MTDPVTPENDAPSGAPAGPERVDVTIRRSPRYLRFAALGAVLGIAVALALTFSFDGAIADYGHFQVFGFIALIAVVVLGSLLLLLALVLDRAAGRRRRSVVAEHATIEDPSPTPEQLAQAPAPAIDPATDTPATPATDTAAERKEPTDPS